jgi:hypothetical protein
VSLTLKHYTDLRLNDALTAVAKLPALKAAPPETEGGPRAPPKLAAIWQCGAAVELSRSRERSPGKTETPTG